MKDNFLIIIDGPMGSGKTTLSKALQKKIGKCALLSMDKIKNFMNDFHNASKIERHFAKYKITAMISRAYLKEGFSVIVEHSFGDIETIKEVLSKSKLKDIKTFVFRLDAPIEIRKKRVFGRDKPKKSEMKYKLDKIKTDYESFVAGKKYEYNKEFDTSKDSVEQITRKMLKVLRK